MAIPIRPKHLKHYKDLGRLFVRHWDRDWGDDQLDEPETPGVDPGGEGEDAEERHSLADDLEELGPTYVKLGQTLSTRPDVVPEPVRRDLERLQDDVEEVPADEIRARIEAELGASVRRLFSEFEDRPLGSASLGQVHRARLRDGRRVAVKVLRPGVRDKVRSDLDALGDMADWLDEHTDLEDKHALCSTLREFSEALRRELDYRVEADNIRRMREMMSAYERIVIPEVVDDYSTSVVLTMELLEGTNLGRMSPVASLDRDFSALADDLFKAYLHQALVEGFVHADPHPGNVLLTRDGRLGIIDLGMVAAVPEDLRERLLRLLLAVSEGDGSGAASIAERIGRQLRHYDPATFRSQLASLIAMKRGKSVGGLQLGTLVMELVRLAGDNGLRLPSELGLLGKTLLNLESVIQILDPTLRPEAALRRHAPGIIGKRLADDLDPGSALRKGLELKRFAEDLPARVDTILETLGRGEFEVGVRIMGEERLVAAVTRVANRVTQGVVLAALIVGAALLMRVETSFTLFGYPGLAIVLFLLAVLGGIHLVWKIGFESGE